MGGISEDKYIAIFDEQNHQSLMQKIQKNVLDFHLTENTPFLEKMHLIR